MAQATCGTGYDGLTLKCDWWIEPVDDYPDVKMRFHYSFKFGKAYDKNAVSGTMTFWFHTNHHPVTIGSYSGKGDTPVLFSGTVDVAWGKNRTVKHAPGFGVNFSWGGGGSNTLEATGTIPEPILDASINEVLPFSVKFNINLKKNPNNFYKVRVYGREVGKSSVLYVDNAKNGAIASNLKEETAYEFNVETWAKSNTGSHVTRAELKATTLTDQLKLLLKDIEWKLGKAFIKMNGAWKKGKKAYIKINGVWVEQKK